jgi:hypothetical protein
MDELACRDRFAYHLRGKRREEWNTRRMSIESPRT